MTSRALGASPTRPPVVAAPRALPTEALARLHPLWASAGVGAVWWLARREQVARLGWGTGSDVLTYEGYAHLWGAGGAPYVHFHPEYPPGGLLSFLVPYLFTGAVDYARSFALWMACFDLLACVLVVQSARLLKPGQRLWPVAAAALYLACTAALFPVVYARFDLVPGAITLAAMYTALRRRHFSAGVWLGVAGATKLWPFALVPLWTLWAARRDRASGVLRSSAGLAVGVSVTSLPAIWRAGWDVLEFLKYHEARGIQIETTWSTLALGLDAAHLTHVQPEHNFGAFHVAGKLPDLLTKLSMPALLVACLAPVLVVLARRRLATSEAFVAATAATVLGFLVTGKVLSPQYMLWIAPLFPLVARTPLSALTALASCVLTTVVYPYLSPALEGLAPGHLWALAALFGRNLLLFGLYLALLGRLALKS